MKYMLLIYGNPGTWAHPRFLHEREALPEAERESRIRRFEELMTEISDSGELVGGEALADPALTRTVRVRDGVPATTDGPFAESKEQLAGYFVVDCESRERAVEIAYRFPDATGSAIEVRPVMDGAGMEM